MRAYILLGAIALAACGGTSGTSDAGLSIDAFCTQPLFALETAMYVASNVRNENDGCKNDTGANSSSIFNGYSTMLTNNNDGTVSLGTVTGMNPPTPSQGKGSVSCNTGALTRDNDIVPVGGCSYHINRTNSITVTGNDRFTSMLVEVQSNRTGCTQPMGVGATCTSTYTWDFAKQ